MMSRAACLTGPSAIRVGCLCHFDAAEVVAMHQLEEHSFRVVAAGGSETVEFCPRSHSGHEPRRCVGSGRVS